MTEKKHVNVIVERKDFELSKIKLVKNGGVDLIYTVKENIDGEIYHEKYHKQSLKDAHPDLINKMNELKPILARVYHLSFFKTILETEEFNSSDKQREIASDAFDEILKKIRISQLSISGKDQNMGVVISGGMIAETNQVMAMNTHHLKLEQIKYGFEEELSEIVNDIINESFEFIYENKRSQIIQLELPLDDTLLDEPSDNPELGDSSYEDGVYHSDF